MRGRAAAADARPESPSMTRRLFTLLLLSACSAPLALCPSLAGAQAKPQKPAPPLEATSVAERVQSFYDKTKTFKAGFEQLYTVKAYDKKKKSKGQVIFQKPGKMSWRYVTNGNRVVSDGKIIKVYEKDNKQMYEQPLEKSQYPAALSFLVGEGNLKKSFKLQLGDSKKMNFEGGYVLLGQPKQATPAYQSIVLYVDGGTYQVRRVILLDAQGNRNRFDFSAPEVNKKPPTGEFEFKPPPGTQIIKP